MKSEVGDYKELEENDHARPQSGHRRWTIEMSLSVLVSYRSAVNKPYFVMHKEYRWLCSVPSVGEIFSLSNLSPITLPVSFIAFMLAIKERWPEAHASKHA